MFYNWRKSSLGFAIVMCVQLLRGFVSVDVAFTGVKLFNFTVIEVYDGLKSLVDVSGKSTLK